MFRPATSSDAPALAELAKAAYGHYVERIGGQPRPMTDDYAEVVRTQRVTVAETGDQIVAMLVLDITGEAFVIENVAVHPDHRGTGLGRTLLQLAETEAVSAGFDSVHLYTHERMTENQARYARIGYVEYDRRSPLVFMRKRLSSSSRSSSIHT